MQGRTGMAKQVRIRRRGRIRRTLIAAAIGVSCLASPSAALAQTEPYTRDEPNVMPTRLDRDEPREPTSVPSSREPGTLPVTGAELTLFVVTGLAAIKTGATLVRRSKP